MEKIKILHITQATVGGTLEYIKLFFKHIDKEKYEVELMCPSYGPMKEEIEKMGFKVYVVEMEREINIFKDFKSFIEMKKYIKKIGPDIVHLHSSKAGVLGKIASYICKVPCIYNAHGWSFSMDSSSLKKNIYAFIERVTSIFCDKIINISMYEQNLALKYHICSQEKMKVIYNGIDINKHRVNIDKEKVKRELKIPKYTVVIGMIARISQQKDPLKFIEIARKLSNKNDNLHFVLVGDGELREDVEKLIYRYNLNNKVTITGWTNNISRYINIFDIGVLTSRWEGFGLVIAEYMSIPIPIVASNVGAIPEIIQDGINGRLIDVDDIDGYVMAIMELIENDKIVDKYNNNSSKILTEKFTIDRLIKEHEELYINTLNHC